MNLKIPRKLIPCACGCGELIEDRDKQAKPKRYKFGHRNRGISYFSGEKHPRWKGGRRRITTGYITILNPKHRFAAKNGYVREHHLIWEEYHKGVILPWGVVHHLNHIRDDNRIENLEAMMKREHDRLETCNRHRTQRIFT